MGFKITKGLESGTSKNSETWNSYIGNGLCFYSSSLGKFFRNLILITFLEESKDFMRLKNSRSRDKYPPVLWIFRNFQIKAGIFWEANFRLTSKTWEFTVSFVIFPLPVVKFLGCVIDVYFSSYIKSVVIAFVKRGRIIRRSSTRPQRSLFIF